MKKLVSIIISFTLALNSFGQEPAEQIRLIIIDSLGKLITPDIWIKSKHINMNDVKVIESKEEHLIIDSIPKFQFGSIVFNGSSYTIFPIIGGHWLDNEYNIKFSFENKVMNINLITNGSSFSDTITFRKGNFVYLHHSLNYSNSHSLIAAWPKDCDFIKHTKEKIIQLNSNSESDFCSLNCEGTIKELDSKLTTILLKNIKYFPEFLIINNLPLGVLIWNKERLQVCYFSDNFIEILRKNYY
ncbi:MAG: hypothetical protein Q8M29_09955 [Bacteroidota bacterium]|nr:hypothetical protein [Bacteroidota bacterium]